MGVHYGIYDCQGTEKACCHYGCIGIALFLDQIVSAVPSLYE